MKKNLHKKAILFLIPVIVLLAVLAPLSKVKAWEIFGIGDIAIGVVNNLIYFVLYAIFQAVGFILGFLAKILDQFIRFTTSSYPDAVESSWKIVRDFTNMFFILALIVMAFGTIFDVQKYHWRNMLVPFLIAALLINFSFVIGSYIIKIADGLTGVFLRQIGSVSDRLGNGLALGNITFNGEKVSALNAISGTLALIAGLLFIIIFGIIAVFAMMCAATFVLVRLGILWVLLIISPFAWAGSIFPNLRSQTWNKWWNTFINWTFSLPIYIFFLSFAFIFLSEKPKFAKTVELTSANVGGILGALFNFNDILFYIITLIFMVGGLVMAFKIGGVAGNGVNAVFGKIEGGVKKYMPGAAYAKGAWGGLKARGEEIKEKGVLGIGGAQRAREAEARMKGWVAGIPGLGQVPGAREAVERARLEEINKETEKLKTELLRIPAEQRKQFLVDARNRKGVAGEAAMFEYARQGYSTLADYKKAMEKFGGENTALGRQYLENLKQAKLSDLFRSPEEELRIARGEVSDTKGFAELRRALFMDLAKRNRINNIEDYREAKRLLSPIPAELKSFIETVKPEFIFGTKEARREALLDYKNRIADSDLAEKLVAYMTDKDRREITNWEMRERALEIVGGKDTFEGKRIVSEINKYNPVINIEADMRTAPGAGPVIDREELVGRITKEIKGKTIADIKKMSAEFFKNSAAQEALRGTLGSKDIAFILKGAPREVREAFRGISEGGGGLKGTTLVTPSGVTGSRTEETQRSREEILRELGKIP